MICYSGIHNSNGCEQEIKIYIDETNNEYVTDTFLEDVKLNTVVKDNCYVIDGIKYVTVQQEYADEKIIAGQEIAKFYHFICSCFCNRKYFVVSNKNNQNV